MVFLVLITFFFSGTMRGFIATFCCIHTAHCSSTGHKSSLRNIKARTFYSQHHGDNEAAHPQQVIHCHKTGFCNMNKGVQTGPFGWMETQTQSAAAELFVPPLPILMSSVVMRALNAPFYPKQKNPSGKRNERFFMLHSIRSRYS